MYCFADRDAHPGRESLWQVALVNVRASVFRMQCSSIPIVTVQITAFIANRMQPHSQPVRENANGSPRMPAPITLFGPYASRRVREGESS